MSSMCSRVGVEIATCFTAALTKTSLNDSLDTRLLEQLRGPLSDPGD